MKSQISFDENFGIVIETKSFYLRVQYHLINIRAVSNSITDAKNPCHLI